MKILSIVGARPEFVQATPVSRALRERHQEILVHTGQHYDYRMSGTFFAELGTPAADYNLEVGSGSHGHQTGEMLAKIEDVLLAEKPDVVIIRGDTNSTLAGALAASKLHVPIVHIEAGERSYDRRMPEEINRVVSDAVANLHFCVSQTAVRRLASEGIVDSVYWVGDVMLDVHRLMLPIARRDATIVSTLGLRRGEYSLATVHRAANTDNPDRLSGIMRALAQVGETVVFPVHPRTRNILRTLELDLPKTVQLIEPVGYLDMLMLEEGARLIATDSGGVQREAYFLGRPCLTLRDETEWTETVDVGWNRLVGADPEVIVGAWWSFAPSVERPPIFGDGTAAQKIADLVDRHFDGAAGTTGATVRPRIAHPAL